MSGVSRSDLSSACAASFSATSVLNRGDRREPMFKNAEDRQRFIITVGEVCAETGWRVHALCLMPNDFHLLVGTPRGNLSAGMQWFLATYT